MASDYTPGTENEAYGLSESEREALVVAIRSATGHRAGCTCCPGFADEIEAAVAQIAAARAGRVEWGHRYPSGSIIGDSSETLARSRARISAAHGDPLVLMRRTVTDWEEVRDV